MKIERNQFSESHTVDVSLYPAKAILNGAKVPVDFSLFSQSFRIKFIVSCVCTIIITVACVNGPFQLNYCQRDRALRKNLLEK